MFLVKIYVSQNHFLFINLFLKWMFKVDSIVFICFLINPETSKPENSSLFSFLKTFTMYDHLIVLK